MAAGQIAALTQTPTDGIDPKHPATGVSRIVDADKGLIEFFMPDGETPRKKFAMCGFASSSREMAPWEDPEWVIIGMNQLNRHIPRADCWYEIHKNYLDACVPGTDHEGWLKQCGIPILMTERLPQLPTSVRNPIERLVAKFNDYYTSTVAHMLAYLIDYVDRKVEEQLATLTGAPDATALSAVQVARRLYSEYEIGIYGIDLVVGEEYSWQRPCAEYLIGQALARNITVRIPKPSALLKQRYRYGYFMEPDDLVKDSDLEKRRVYLANEWQKHHDTLNQLTGHIEELKYWQEFRGLRERGAEVQA